jgi:hypothetical protein
MWGILALIAGILLVIGVVAFVALFFGLTLAWSGAFRKDDNRTLHQVPKPLQNKEQHAEVVLGLPTDSDLFWV